MDTVGEILRGSERPADSLAVICEGTEIDHHSLISRVDAVALYLADLGVAPGERLAILDRNSLEYLVVYHAAAVIGAVLQPLNRHLVPRELAAILRHSGARWLIESSATRQRAQDTLALDHSVEASIATETLPLETTERAPLHPASPDEIVHLYYTSGTSGVPKAVGLTHRNVVSHAHAAIDALDIGVADRWGHIAPMFHLADAWACFGVAAAGGTHVIVERFEPGELLARIERDGITVTNLIPTMLNLLVKEPTIGEHDLSSLRLMLSGGAPIAPQVVRQVVATLGCEYVQSYGLTETSPYLTLSRPGGQNPIVPADEDLRMRSRTGWSFPTVELRVVDDDGVDVSTDDRQVGEILARGATVFPGYWQQPEETEEAFDDGWFRTGDLATIDATGSVNIVDRRKDVIISGGENVWSTEVEAVLHEHPAVLECAVYGVPDERWGEAVRAALVAMEGVEIDTDLIEEYCRVRLAGFKVPHGWDLLEALPRTGSGKIRKATLRERWGAGGAPAEDEEDTGRDRRSGHKPLDGE